MFRPFPSVVPHGFLRPLLVALILAGSSPNALALDPALKLTQYIHRIWQVPQGLPEATIYSVRQTRRRVPVARHADRAGPVRRGAVHRRRRRGGFAAEGRLGPRPARRPRPRLVGRDQRRGPVPRPGAGRHAPRPARRVAVRRRPPPVPRRRRHPVGLHVRRAGLGERFGKSRRLPCRPGTADGRRPRRLPGEGRPPVGRRRGERAGGFRRGRVHPTAAGVGAGVLRRRRPALRRRRRGLGRDDGRAGPAEGRRRAPLHHRRRARRRLGVLPRRGPRRRAVGRDQGRVQPVPRRRSSRASARATGCRRAPSTRWRGPRREPLGRDQARAEPVPRPPAPSPSPTSEGLPSNDTGPVFQDARRRHVGSARSARASSRFDGTRFSVLAAPQGLAGEFGPRAGATTAAGGPVGRDATGASAASATGGWSRATTRRRACRRATCGASCRDRGGAFWVGTSGGAGGAGAAGGSEAAAGPPPSPSDRRWSRGGTGRCSPRRRAGFTRARGGAARRAPRDGRRAAVRDVDAFYEDHDGLLWMGTAGGGLRLFDGGKALPLLDARRPVRRRHLRHRRRTPTTACGWRAAKASSPSSRADLRAFAAGARTRSSSTPFSPTDGAADDRVQGGRAAGGVADARRAALVLHDPRARSSSTPTACSSSCRPPAGGDRGRDRQRPDARARRRSADLPPGVNNLEFRYTGPELPGAGRGSRSATSSKGSTGTGSTPARGGEAFYTNLPAGRLPLPRDRQERRRA